MLSVFMAIRVLSIGWKPLINQPASFQSSYLAFYTDNGITIPKLSKSAVLVSSAEPLPK